MMKNDLHLKSRHRMGAIALESSDKYPGLQAADMLAYQGYKFGKERMQSGQPARIKDLPPLLSKLITNRKNAEDFPFLDREGLNVVLHNFPVELRSPGHHPVTLKPSEERRFI